MIEGRDDVNDDAPPTAARMNWSDEIRKIREGQGLSSAVSPSSPTSIARRCCRWAIICVTIST
jgi:hypothetical protein